MKLIIYYKILSLPHVACYALCIKFTQSLALRLGEKIFSTDTRINLFCLMAVVAARNPPFSLPFDISGCVFISYCHDPWKRFKGEINEVLLAAYHNLAHKGKLTSCKYCSMGYR